MAYTAQGGVPVSWTPEEFERWLGQQAQARNVTTDAQWSGAIDSLTDAQALALFRMLMKRVIRVG